MFSCGMAYLCSDIHVHLVFIDVCIYKYDDMYDPFVIYSKYLLE